MVPFIFSFFLLLSWVLLGMERSKVGFRSQSLPPLRMMTGPVQHFRSAILDAWRFHVFARPSDRQGFLGEAHGQGGHAHRDMATSLTGMDKHVRKVTRQNHHHHHQPFHSQVAQFWVIFLWNAS